MNCPKCGNLVDGTFAFCEHCGSPLRQQQPNYQQQAYQQPNYQQQAYQQPNYQQQAYQQPNYQQQAYQQPVKKENVATGTVGAFIGALVGALCIILLGQIGYVASISGFVLAVCTLKGYELLGGKLGTAGIVICVVLMLVTPYLADRIDWAIELMGEVSTYTFGEAFAKIPELIGATDRYRYIDSGDYYSRLGMLYGFTLLGGFSTVWGKIKERKK